MQQYTSCFGIMFYLLCWSCFVLALGLFIWNNTVLVYVRGSNVCVVVVCAGQAKTFALMFCFALKQYDTCL